VPAFPRPNGGEEPAGEGSTTLTGPRGFDLGELDGGGSPCTAVNGGELGRKGKSSGEANRRSSGSSQRSGSSVASARYSARKRRHGSLPEMSCRPGDGLSRRRGPAALRLGSA
jgi:hypothetical protein